MSLLNKDSPAAPDYTGAAQAQGASSRENTEQQSWANRPNQYTPFGNSTWSQTPQWDPTTGQYLNKWSQNVTLDPESQAALDSQQRLATSKSQLAESMTGRLQNDFAQPMDWNNLPQAGASVSAPEYGNLEDFRTRQEDALYGKATSRLDPQWQQRQEAVRNQLYAAGVKEGDAGYERAMANFNRDRNDAYDQATFGSITGGGQEQANQIAMGGQIQGQQQGASSYQNQIRQQAIAEQLQQRGTSLNEANAIMSGTQVGMPSMPNFTPAGNAAATPYMAAAQGQGQSALDQFNANQMQNQGIMSGLTTLGAAGIMAG